MCYRFDFMSISHLHTLSFPPHHFALDSQRMPLHSVYIVNAEFIVLYGKVFPSSQAMGHNSGRLQWERALYRRTRQNWQVASLPQFFRDGEVTVVYLRFHDVVMIVAGTDECNETIRELHRDRTGDELRLHPFQLWLVSHYMVTSHPIYVMTSMRFVSIHAFCFVLTYMHPILRICILYIVFVKSQDYLKQFLTSSPSLAGGKRKRKPPEVVPKWTLFIRKGGLM